MKLSSVLKGNLPLGGVGMAISHTAANALVLNATATTVTFSIIGYVYDKKAHMTTKHTHPPNMPPRYDLPLERRKDEGIKIPTADAMGSTHERARMAKIETGFGKRAAANQHPRA